MNGDMSYIANLFDQKWCHDNDVRITVPGAADYPAQFANYTFRPGVLFYWGKPVWQTHKLLAVVGSRSPQTASLTWLDDVLTEALGSMKNLAIVSGGARGIDQKAHQIALRAQKPTLAFLPSGLRHSYPAEFADWIPEIIKQGGCVISQFQPSELMQKRFFRERNRMIAAISDLTLIVECRRRSGTMLTAGYCRDLYKTLAVMPCHPYSQGLGGLDLINDGALIVRDATDLLLSIGHAPK